MSRHTETQSVTLDGSGNGTVQMAPVPYGQSWAYVRVSVRITTGDASGGGYCEMFAGDDLPNRYVDGSSSPWQDTATFGEDQAVVVAPERMTTKFYGCDPGAVAYVTADYVRK